jgi:hypothetical protein
LSAKVVRKREKEGEREQQKQQEEFDKYIEKG